ncbi:uncharacterized protein LOC120646693 [Panicum virgatum]|uniref:uncharacterized protein LOC120646693 n=1 Tax=Panicum virgatum TaxID=38727 RepID=UPI0019D660F9|nr:uncharacterized protein LOC120646693 [Panicum virgatum]
MPARAPASPGPTGRCAGSLYRRFASLPARTPPPWPPPPRLPQTAHLRPSPAAPSTSQGTIDEPREGRDIGTEHEDDVWWTYPEEAKNQEYMLGPEYSPSKCHLTNTDVVLIPGIEANQDSH